MNWTDLIQHYGYIAIFIGTLFEGETVLMIGAYAVHQHILHFPMLIAVAMLGSFIGDQFYYQMGARYGQNLSSRMQNLHKNSIVRASLLNVILF